LGFYGKRLRFLGALVAFVGGHDLTQRLTIKKSPNGGLDRWDPSTGRGRVRSARIQYPFRQYDGLVTVWITSKGTSGDFQRDQSLRKGVSTREAKKK
jgi:hypothetical protein